MNLAIVHKLQTTLTYKQKPTKSNSATQIVCPSANSSSQSGAEGVQPSPLSTGNTLSESNRLLQQQDRSLLCVRTIPRQKGMRNQIDLSTRRLTPLYYPNTPIRIRSTHCRTTASAKTTKMLLAASTVFLVFNLPYHLLLFCFLFIKKQPSWMLSAVNIARLWFFASFCMNFFVYAICGQRFRNEVVRLFSCSYLRRYFESHKQKKSQERQNSIYLSHRLLRISSTRLSHTN
jgi:hypothetical protein